MSRYRESSARPREATYELHCDQQHSFQGKRAVAQDEQILETGAEQLQHHRVVPPAANTKVVHSRHTLYTEPIKFLFAKLNKFLSLKLWEP
jgi:hypothetical protein